MFTPFPHPTSSLPCLRSSKPFLTPLVLGVLSILLLSSCGFGDSEEEHETEPVRATPSEEHATQAELGATGGAQTIHVEAEQMALSQGFAIQRSGVASGGAWIQTQGQGTASWEFKGQAGRYNVRVVYFDEEDGTSTLSASIGTQEVDRWRWDKSLGSDYADLSTLTDRVVGSAQFAPGTRLTLSGQADRAEPLRIDRVVLEPCQGSVCVGSTAPQEAGPKVPQLVGFGQGVTGGRGGTVYPITSTSSSPSVKGSVPWALAQGAPNEPRVLLLMVEGGIFLPEELRIRNSNLTLDGSFAPGAGAWFEGDRVEFLGSNVLVQHVSFLGNDPTPEPNSDSVKVGNYKSGPDLSGIYFRHCAFLYGRDETLAFTTRGNGQTSGPRVLQSTIESSIIANAVGGKDGDHKYGLFIGDGTEGLTVVGNVFANLQARAPFVREHTKRVEFLNNVIYNGRENQSSSMSSSIHFVGNVYRKGPISKTSSIRPIHLSDRRFRAYLDDNTTSNDPASARLFHGSGQALTSPIFQSSGVDVLPSAQVLDHVLATSGPRRRGVAPSARFVARILKDVQTATAPSRYTSYPGPVPTTTGAGALSPSEYIPAAYSALFPGDARLEQVIASGPWKGRQVWERVSAWQTQ